MIPVVIPSQNAQNLSACLAAIRKNEPKAYVVAIDDGMDWRDHPNLGLDGGVDELILGKKPFVFARNVNAGIWAAVTDNAAWREQRLGCIRAGHNGVVILNDDALLETPGGFSAMEEAQRANPEYGIIGAACNNVGNPNQYPRGIGLREDPRMVCFVCVYIPRATLQTVGFLDERFVDYGMDDDDYCLRVRKAGLKIGIFDGCVVDHSSLRSSYRGEAAAGGDFRPNMRRFIEKWGMDNWGRPAEQALALWGL